MTRMSTKRKLSIIVAFEDSLLFAAATLLHSVREHLSIEAEVYCYVEGVHEEARAEFQAFCATELGLQTHLVRDEDMSDLARASIDRMTGDRSAGCRAALARLVMIDELPETVTRAIYLDVDTLAVADLAGAISLPLEGAVVGAVQAPLKKLQGRFGADPYFNSGVLIVDRAQWAGHHVRQHCEDWFDVHGSRASMLDQDALNAVMNPKKIQTFWQPLDPGWNALTPIFLHRGPIVYKRPEVLRIVHFSGPMKPWLRPGHPLAELYLRHLDAVPFHPGPTSTGLFG